MFRAARTATLRKQGKEWHAYLVKRAESDASERYERVTEFLQEYGYAPDPNDLRVVAEDFYADVANVAMTLINSKVKRVQGQL